MAVFWLKKEGLHRQAPRPARLFAPSGSPALPLVSQTAVRVGALGDHRRGGRFLTPLGCSRLDMTTFAVTRSLLRRRTITLLPLLALALLLFSVIRLFARS